MRSFNTNKLDRQVVKEICTGAQYKHQSSKCQKVQQNNQEITIHGNKMDLEDVVIV